MKLYAYREINESDKLERVTFASWLRDQDEDRVSFIFGQIKRTFIQKGDMDWLPLSDMEFSKANQLPDRAVTFM